MFEVKVFQSGEVVLVMIVDGSEVTWYAPGRNHHGNDDATSVMQQCVEVSLDHSISCNIDMAEHDQPGSYSGKS